MIVVLTSNYDVGVLQLAFQMKKEFRKICGESVVFVPDQAKLNENENVETYERKSSLIPFDKQYDRISKRIMKYNPSLVYVCDSNLITSRIVLGLPKSVPVCMTVHDVETHPTYNSSLSKIKEMIKRPYTNCALKRANHIVLMSKNSYTKYKKKRPKYANKLSLIRLGAHVPDVISEQPMEIKNATDYILFFGRLDKYKGIINLLKAYEIGKERINHKIVIAGRGTLTDEEQRLIDKYPKSIILVKRYISDGEMIWLFENAACTVLPYIEASQSGVLSISYYFGKPVIVSDLEGLTEFVENGITGAIFHSVDDLSEQLIQVPRIGDTMKEMIYDYYEQNLDWEKSIRSMLADLDI